MRDEARPSVATGEYWIGARRKAGSYPEPTARCGKWLVFVPCGEVDAMWERIKGALESGLLGDEAKVSTARPRRHLVNPQERVICVYSYDYEDLDDVRRIREELRKLGVVKPIPYKADHDTGAGKYKALGYGHVGKYFE